MTRYIQTIPKAEKLMPALQKIGYKWTNAIADLIDNSISAESNNINVKLNWNDGENSEILIIDDGIGLTEDDLIQAMNMANNSDAERSDNDLGRFGLGMKTASLSIGRRLTVISKKDDKVSDARWDIDEIKEIVNNKNPEYSNINHGWVISLDNDDDKTKSLRNELNQQKSGTILLIDKLNRNNNNNNNNKYKKEALNNFASLKREIINHISIVFHRFIEEDNINIYVDGEPIIPWNPVSPHKKEELEPEEKTYDGYKYVIKKYVLALPFNLPENEVNLAAGTGKWHRNQGIYVYRNKRLIVYGSWLNYSKKDPAYNLARIIVNIPSKHDKLWDVDIKKSQITVPDFMDSIFKRAVRDCTNNSVKIWNSRGHYSKRESNKTYIGAVWEQKTFPSDGYYIDRTNLLLRDIMNESNSNVRKKLNSYLTLVENCYPSIQVAMLESRICSDSDDANKSEEKMIILNNFRELINNLKKISPNEDIRRLTGELTYFMKYKNDIENILKEEGI